MKAFKFKVNDLVTSGSHHNPIRGVVVKVSKSSCIVEVATTGRKIAIQNSKLTFQGR